MTNGIVAPAVWLRNRQWGADVRLLATGQMKRLLDNPRIAAVMKATNPSLPARDPISVVVFSNIMDEIAKRHADRIGESLRSPRVVTYMSGDESGNALTVCSGRERTMADMVYAYLQGGSQTFQIGANLAGELSRTDIDEVRCSDIQAPYPYFYLRFEGLHGTEPGGSTLDGFMVVILDDKRGGRGIRITPMTAEPPDLLSPGSMFTGMDVAFMDPDEPIAKAIADRFREKVFGEPPKPEEEAQMLGRYEDLKALAETATANIEEKMEAWLRLVVNALLYIDTCGQTGERIWPQGAPAELVAKANNERTGAKKAEQRLVAMGYTRLFRHEISCNVEDDGGTHRTPRAHWRRGHWRRQRHGAGSREIKLIRIRPALIGGKGGGAPTPRTYVLDGDI